MTPDEYQRMNTLCREIAVEPDREKFTRLVEELNNLLETKDYRTEEPDPHTSPGFN